MDDGRLTLEIQHADGTYTRWTDQEIQAADIPNDIVFGTVMPGGFGTFSTSLFRDLNPREDESLYDKVAAYGPGGDCAYEGRLMQFPRQTGSTITVEPGGVGFSTLLSDYEGFVEIYADRDIGRWGSPPLERQARIMLEGSWRLNLSDPAAGNGTRGLTMSHQLAGTQKPLSEAWYDGGNAGVRKVFVTFTEINTQATDLNWFLTVQGAGSRTGDDIIGTTAGDLHDGRAAFSGLVTLTSANRYAFMQWGYSATLVASPEIDRVLQVTDLCAYGDHGLPLAAVDGLSGYGVYASDVIADAIKRCAPQIHYTTGTGGTIQPTQFVIPHLVFDTPTTAADVVATTNAPHNWDWAVWEDATFYYQPTASGVEWQARIADGAGLVVEGDTGDQVINGVVVTWPDQIRGQSIAGPIGSGYDVESALLQDTSLTNPATARGLRRWPRLDISNPTTDQGAVQIGAAYLAERNLATRRGSMTLTGRVRHPTEGLVPVWRVRAGDTVRLVDRPDDPPRRIISTSYSHSSRSISLDLDSTPHRLDSLLTRWGLAANG